MFKDTKAFSGFSVDDVPRAAQFYGSYRGFAQQGPVPALLKRRFYYPHSDEGPPVNGFIADGDRPLPGGLIDYEIGPPSGTRSSTWSGSRTGGS